MRVLLVEDEVRLADNLAAHGAKPGECPRPFSLT
jgi:hypothetical protein